MEGFISKLDQKVEFYGVIDAGDEYEYMFGPQDVIGGPQAFAQLRLGDDVEFNVGSLLAQYVVKALNVRRIG